MWLKLRSPTFVFGDYDPWLVMWPSSLPNILTLDYSNQNFEMEVDLPRLVIDLVIWDSNDNSTFKWCLSDISYNNKKCIMKTTESISVYSNMYYLCWWDAPRSWLAFPCSLLQSWWWSGLYDHGNDPRLLFCWFTKSCESRFLGMFVFLHWI